MLGAIVGDIVGSTYEFEMTTLPDRRTEAPEVKFEAAIVHAAMQDYGLRYPAADYGARAVGFTRRALSLTTASPTAPPKSSAPRGLLRYPPKIC